MKQTEKYNSPEGFVHSYFPHGIIEGDFRVRPDNNISYYQGSINLSAKRNDDLYNVEPANELLPNRGLESPGEVIAMALLSAHPLVSQGECNFSYLEIQNCPQGIFKLQDRHGRNWVYVLKSVETHEEGMKLLWALSDSANARFGYFNLVSTPDYQWKIKGEAKEVTAESVSDAVWEKRRQLIRDRESNVPETASSPEAAPGDSIRGLLANLATTNEMCAALNCLVDLANSTKNPDYQKMVLEELTAYYQTEIAPYEHPDPKLAYRLYSLIHTEPFYTGSSVPVVNSHEAGCHNLDYVLEIRRAKIAVLPAGPNL